MKLNESLSHEGEVVDRAGRPSNPKIEAAAAAAEAERSGEVSALDWGDFSSHTQT